MALFQGLPRRQAVWMSHRITSYNVCYTKLLRSTLLLHVAAETLGTDKVLAITATSEAFPAQECEESRALAIACNTRHILLPVTPLDDPRVAANGRDRCYFCKRLIFSACLGKARELGFPFLLDGTNADDDLDHRPGIV